MKGLLQDYVTRQAEQRAEEVAVLMADRLPLTYGELEQASNQLAWLLKEEGCRQGDRVCLFLSKSPSAVISMLAVLKADCIYVPIDLGSPVARVEKIFRAAAPRLVLADAAAHKVLDELFANEAVTVVPVGWVEDVEITGAHIRSAFAKSDWARRAPTLVPRRNSSDAPAHILFTSGSTGTPKGVVITHANVMSFVQWATRYFQMTPSDRVSCHPPLHFDLATFDIYGTLSVGAQLHMVPPSGNLLPQQLAEFIRMSRLTQWFSVPSTLTYMAKFGVLQPGDFPTLARVLWCGEVLPTPTLTHWMRRLPHVRFTNLYGPTEATIASSYYTVPACPKSDSDPIPIGTPCEGEELLVLDEKLRPSPIGEIGDLYIGGAGLSPGYWRDEETTRSAFLPDPRSSAGNGRIYRTGDLGKMEADGLCYFVGRADSQVKSRGYRIELGEIETALYAVPGIRECAVVAISTGGFETTAICCAYAADRADLSPAWLRRQLQKVLPDYMLPSRWKTFDRLPKNVNGKVDRRTLKELLEREVHERPLSSRSEGSGSRGTTGSSRSSDDRADDTPQRRPRTTHPRAVPRGAEYRH
jgi:amino acid adenylation domain-containing protein